MVTVNVIIIIDWKNKTRHNMSRRSLTVTNNNNNSKGEFEQLKLQYGSVKDELSSERLTNPMVSL